MYYYVIRDPYPQSKLLGPEYSVFQTRGQEYKESISRLIKDRHYDKLLLTKGQYVDEMFIPDIVENYTLINEVIVPMPYVDQNWTIEIWEPIK